MEDRNYSEEIAKAIDEEVRMIMDECYTRARRILDDNRETMDRIVTVLRERETIFDLEHPTRGRFSVIGCPVRLSDSPVAAKRAPLKGEHTEDVLRSLAGYTPEEIRQLRENKVI